MADRETEVRRAIEAIKRAGEAHLAIRRPAVDEMERQVEIIVQATKSMDIAHEGARLLANAWSAYVNRDNKHEIVRAARLHGAIARFEFALQQVGYLTPGQETSHRTIKASR